jgi:hypothetical protein
MGESMRIALARIMKYLVRPTAAVARGRRETAR